MPGGILKHHSALTERGLKMPVGYRGVQVLKFVQSWAQVWGQAPSYSEIMSGVGINSKGEVSRIVGSLEKRGLLFRVGRGRVRRIALEMRPGVQSITGGWDINLLAEPHRASSLSIPGCVSCQRTPARKGSAKC